MRNGKIKRGVRRTRPRADPFAGTGASTSASTACATCGRARLSRVPARPTSVATSSAGTQRVGSGGELGN